MGCATMAGHVCWHKENTPTMGEWQLAREGRYIHYTTHAIMLKTTGRGMVDQRISVVVTCHMKDNWCYLYTKGFTWPYS